MPLQATSGAASYDGFGGGVPVVPNYIEDVFSTYLYTGNGSTQTITNGIDLAGKGGLVWMKQRNGSSNNFIGDTVRGTSKYLVTNTAGSGDDNDSVNRITSFNSSGFTLGSNTETNFSGNSYVSWSIRKQPKLLDIQTYTGNGTAGRQISHSLGGEVGCIIVKNLTDSAEWAVYHRGNGSTPQNNFLRLNKTSALQTSSIAWNNTAPTTTNFTVGAGSYEDPSTGDLTNTNLSGKSYIAYLFAHNAGGFGLTGTDNVISCGSLTSDGTNFTSVDLGYEPQFVLAKMSSGESNWQIFDNMRGIPTGSNDPYLLPNTSGAEATNNNWIDLTSTGFRFNGAPVGSGTLIYIAIRKGPMKVPTSGTSVFGLRARSGTGANATVTGGQTADAVLIKNRGIAVGGILASRLTNTSYVGTSASSAEFVADATTLQANPWDVMNGVKVGTTSAITNRSGDTFINYLFRRAPSFMDVVCYTGTGTSTTQTHNLTVAPELIIQKNRSAVDTWYVYSKSLIAASGQYLQLNSSAATQTGANLWNYTNPTSSIFYIRGLTSPSGLNCIAYLFATCAGVSKVGSYTGTATTLQIDCGFTAGARFVLIKRTDSTGDWYVWDTARGIVSGNDPYFLLNTTAAEVTSTDYIDTYSAGFELSSTAPAAINASGGTFIFLAIA